MIPFAAVLTLFSVCLPLQAADVPELAALFQSHSIDAGTDAATTHRWKLWRRHDRIEIEQGDGAIGEVWERLADGEIRYLWLLHSHHFAIRYTASDLKAVHNAPRWSAKAHLISPDLLEKLSRTGSDEWQGLAVEQYRGRVGDYALSVGWIPSLQLPATLAQSSGKERKTITLLSVYPDQQAPWQPQNHDDYEDMDFADIGDNEAHPLARFYLRSGNLAVGPHVHAH